MTQQEIEKILDLNSTYDSVLAYEGERFEYIETDIIKSAKEIYKLHLEDKIKLLESVIEHPTKPGYKRADIVHKLSDFIKELKTLEE